MLDIFDGTVTSVRDASRASLRAAGDAIEFLILDCFKEEVEAIGTSEDELLIALNEDGADDTLVKDFQTYLGGEQEPVDALSRALVDAAFAKAREHPIGSLVELGRRAGFLSPWANSGRGGKLQKRYTATAEFLGRSDWIGDPDARHAGCDVGGATVSAWAHQTLGKTRMTATATIATQPDRLLALERANEIRHARAQLKRRIEAGHLSAAQVILDCPPEARRWPVAALLACQRQWGSTTCCKFLARNQISEAKRIGELTDRQRRLLAAQLAQCGHGEARSRSRPVPLRGRCRRKLRGQRATQSGQCRRNGVLIARTRGGALSPTRICLARSV